MGILVCVPCVHVLVLCAGCMWYVQGAVLMCQLYAGFLSTPAGLVGRYTGQVPVSVLPAAQAYPTCWCPRPKWLHSGEEFSANMAGGHQHVVTSCSWKGPVLQRPMQR